MASVSKSNRWSYYHLTDQIHLLRRSLPSQSDDDGPEKKFVLYTSDNPRLKANAALIASLYAMVIDRISPADAFHPLSEVSFVRFGFIQVSLSCDSGESFSPIFDLLTSSSLPQLLSISLNSNHSEMQVMVELISLWTFKICSTESPKQSLWTC